MDFLDAVDLRLFRVINSYAETNNNLDSLLVFFAESDLTKGIPVMVIWWGLWFYKQRDGKPNIQAQARLLATLLVSVTAIFAGRLLGLVLPFRRRPLHSHELDIRLPADVTPLTIDVWSSFPSDHAVLFFALAVCILQVQRTSGFLLILHAMFIIGLPRIFAGFHFPGDILGGALIGLALGVLLLRPFARLVLSTGVLGLQERFGHLFYPALFFLTLQNATMFASARRGASAAAKLLKLVLGLEGP